MTQYQTSLDAEFPAAAKFGGITVTQLAAARGGRALTISRRGGSDCGLHDFADGPYLWFLHILGHWRYSSKFWRKLPESGSGGNHIFGAVDAGDCRCRTSLSISWQRCRSLVCCRREHTRTLCMPAWTLLKVSLKTRHRSRSKPGPRGLIMRTYPSFRRT